MTTEAQIRVDSMEPILIMFVVVVCHFLYRYDIHEVIGQGTFGVVRKCSRKNKKTKKRNVGGRSSSGSSQEMLAIKTILKSKVPDVEILKREVTILAEVNHPNIIKLIDVYEDTKYIHLITELCTGGELYEKICEYAAAASSTAEGGGGESSSVSIPSLSAASASNINDNEINGNENGQHESDKNQENRDKQQPQPQGEEEEGSKAPQLPEQSIQKSVSRSKPKRRFLEIDSARIIGEILDAIAYCHEVNIVHRDLKAENFLFVNKELGVKSPIKIIDFGLSRHTFDVMQSRVGSKCVICIFVSSFVLFL